MMAGPWITNISANNLREWGESLPLSYRVFFKPAKVHFNRQIRPARKAEMIIIPPLLPDLLSLIDAFIDFYPTDLDKILQIYLFFVSFPPWHKTSQRLSPSLGRLPTGQPATQSAYKPIRHDWLLREFCLSGLVMTGRSDRGTCRLIGW